MLMMNPNLYVPEMERGLWDVRKIRSLKETSDVFEVCLKDQVS